MKIKICGITNTEDATMCEELGADAIGCVHVHGRGRSLGLMAISDIFASLSPFTTRVLVCAPASVEDAVTLMDMSDADVLQTYSLSVEELLELRSNGIRTIRAVDPFSLEAEAYEGCADALLFECGVPGTGTAYDHSSVPMDGHRRVIIAGGLDPSNVSQVARLQPYAVDVSSGVERVKGRKDPSLVEGFIRRCRA